eukprot:CAMPEP_0203886542 /NCGR_PEP_ID=MMETSP0359-20131031/30345_1 /ASSEMBLY_ACC=CAM_ASM_000338 /TAXON_ID=268821 /ORGANISM="Scrippsiella Hangoei, Strain SHTV-5" /LENGTH=68 /DNA_ID=CAMNT_0050807383 /DNA_START=382 /DNA_END=586 /DNA_ORIENTATION=-
MAGAEVAAEEFPFSCPLQSSPVLRVPGGAAQQLANAAEAALADWVFGQGPAGSPCKEQLRQCSQIEHS